MSAFPTEALLELAALSWPPALLGAGLGAAGAALLLALWARARAKGDGPRDVSLLSPTLAVELLEGAARRAWLLSVTLDLLELDPDAPATPTARAIARACRLQLIPLRQGHDEPRAQALEQLLWRAARLARAGQLDDLAPWHQLRAQLDTGPPEPGAPDESDSSGARAPHPGPGAQK